MLQRIGYNLNVMRQYAWLVFNPITVDNHAPVFYCTPVGRTSDCMIASTKSYCFSLFSRNILRNQKIL